MRPKKVILCVDGDSHALSVRTFLLETRGYRVVTAATAQEALKILERTVPGTLDCLVVELLIVGSAMDGNELCRRAKALHPELRSLLTSRDISGWDRELHVDYFLPKGGQSAAEFLERLRILVARKRGPKAHFPVPEYLQKRAHEIAQAAVASRINVAAAVRERDMKLTGGEITQALKPVGDREVEDKLEVMA